MPGLVETESIFAMPRLKSLEGLLSYWCSFAVAWWCRLDTHTHTGHPWLLIFFFLSLLCRITQMNAAFLSFSQCSHFLLNKFNQNCQWTNQKAQVFIADPFTPGGVKNETWIILCLLCINTFEDRQTLLDDLYLNAFIRSEDTEKVKKKRSVRDCWTQYLNTDVAKMWRETISSDLITWSTQVGLTGPYSPAHLTPVKRCVKWVPKSFLLKRSWHICLGCVPVSLAECTTQTHTLTVLPKAPALTQQCGTSTCVTIWGVSHHQPNYHPHSPIACALSHTLFICPPFSTYTIITLYVQSCLSSKSSAPSEKYSEKKIHFFSC